MREELAGIMCRCKMVKMEKNGERKGRTNPLPLCVGVHLIKQLVDELLYIIIRQGAGSDNISNTSSRKCLHRTYIHIRMYM